MIVEKYGLLGTNQEQLLHEILTELRKQNELLASLVQPKPAAKPKKEKEVKS
jgi:hypothetical protein